MIDVAQTPGWATCIVGSEGAGLLASRLSDMEQSRKLVTDFPVAGWFVEVRAMRSVIRLVCAYGSLDSTAWMSSLLKWYTWPSMDDSQIVRPGLACGHDRRRGISQCTSM